MPRHYKKESSEARVERKRRALELKERRMHAKRGQQLAEARERDAELRARRQWRKDTPKRVALTVLVKAVNTLSMVGFLGLFASLVVFLFRPKPQGDTSPEFWVWFGSAMVVWLLVGMRTELKQGKGRMGEWARWLQDQERLRSQLGEE